MKAIRLILKKYLVAGALVLIPVAGTIWVLKAFILWMDGFFFSLLPGRLQPAAVLGFHFPGMGLVLTLILVLLVGITTRLYIGRKLIAIGDRWIAKVPLGRAVYGAIKQFLSAVFAGRGTSFRKVVLVEYPREGNYMIGFITSGEQEVMSKVVGQSLISVFIPTTPNPTTGFLLLLPEEKVRPVDMTPEEAFKMVVSGGVVSRGAGHHGWYQNHRSES